MSTKRFIFWRWLVASCILILMNAGFASAPLWTFTPDPNFPPTISLTTCGSATIKYTVTNQSHRTYTLVMSPISGITQITSSGNCSNPFTLAYRQSCTLNLLINGSALEGNIHEGPLVCQQGGLLQCYRPSLAASLHITRVPIAQYLITPSAGSNGAISPNTPQTVVAGSSLTFSAVPNMNYQVDQWFVDGNVAQVGGANFTLANITTNHSIEVTFTPAGTIYAGLENGNVYFSNNNGLTWTATTIPSSGNAVNSVFAISTQLYAASEDNRVYHSINNGATWSRTDRVPDNTPVNSVFVNTVNNVTTIYAGSEGGSVYYSTNGTTWTATASAIGQPINSLFITPAQVIYAGSEDGKVYYSTNNGASWIPINGPSVPLANVPIQNVFATNNQLFINTRHTTTNPTLPVGTIDFEYTYTSDSLTSSTPTWTLTSQIAYTFFVNRDASIILAGTQDGYVFSLTTGNELGFISNSVINSLFFLG